jgi:hypothetical protein
MSTLSELVQEAKLHRVYLKNKKGKPLIDISLLLALILVIAAPHLVLAVLIGVAFEIIDVEYDGKEKSPDSLI